MITLKPLVFAHQRRADGTYNVKIRVTYKGRQKYIATTIIARSGDLTRSLGLKAGAVKTAADALVARMERILADFPEGAPACDCGDVVRYIRARMEAQTFALDFYAWAEEFLRDKSPQTAEVYRVALRSFRRTTGSPLDINAIRRETVQRYIDENPTIDTGAKLAFLAPVFRAARERYNDEEEGVILIPRNPFASFSCTPSRKPKGAKALDAAVIQRLIDERPRTRRQRQAVALALLSFVCMGANLADIKEAAPVRGDVWAYKRRKTRTRRADEAEMRVELLEPARVLASYVSGKDRGKWVDVPDGYNKSVNAHLRGWAEEQGMPRFTIYSLRKAWATIARRKGVEKATIDEGLAHVGDYRLADIYIERDYSAMNRANAVVVGSFDWSNLWARPLPGTEGGGR